MNSHKLKFLIFSAMPPGEEIIETYHDQVFVVKRQSEKKLKNKKNPQNFSRELCLSPKRTNYSTKTVYLFRTLL